MAVDTEAIAARWSEITDQSIGEAQVAIEALLDVIDEFKSAATGDFLRIAAALHALASEIESDLEPCRP